MDLFIVVNLKWPFFPLDCQQNANIWPEIFIMDEGGGGVSFKETFSQWEIFSTVCSEEKLTEKQPITDGPGRTQGVKVSQSFSWVLFISLW